MSYEDFQFQRDGEWRRAWADLPPEQRASLERGLASNREYPVETAGGRVIHDTATEKAKGEGREIVGREADAVGMCEHHTDFADWTDMADKLDQIPEQLQEDYGLSAEQARHIAAWHARQVTTEVQRQSALLLLRIIGFFILPGNLLIRAHALAHAARMAAMNGLRSLRDSAKACGVSVEAIRKIAWRWVDLLELPPLEGAKSEAARAKYSADKKNNHWRHQKCKAAPTHGEASKPHQSE